MWWAGLFFVSGVNLIFFGFLSLAECTAADRAPRMASDEERWWPVGSALSFALAAAIAALSGLLSIGAVAFLSAGYGWGLFLGVPFGMGFLATMLHSLYEDRSFKDSALVSLASLAMCGGLAIGLALEGGICMARFRCCC